MNGLRKPEIRVKEQLLTETTQWYMVDFRKYFQCAILMVCTSIWLKENINDKVKDQRIEVALLVILLFRRFQDSTELNFTVKISL